MDLLQEVYNHVVLPPRLPGQEDRDIEAVSHDLLTRFIHACETLRAVSEQPWAEAFRTLRGSLRACLSLNRGRLERKGLLEHFRQLKPGYTLILHVVEQNAALIIRCQAQNEERKVIFEAFEASPTSERVLATENALTWDFPGRSAYMPVQDFANESFQESLATFLEQASMEKLHSLQAQAQKANVSVAEVRDTTDPALITQMLISLVEALGGYENVPRLRKRVRDDVNISHGGKPWRRLPFWLVLRVAAQRHLSLALGNEAGRASYKLLMCTLMSHLLQNSAGLLTPELTITLRAKLCRRMAKLEMDRAKIALIDAEVYDSLFNLTGPLIKDIIQNVTLQVENSWELFKHKTTRRIPRLPLRASEQAVRLSLPNSGRHLDGLLCAKFSEKAEAKPLDLPQPLDKSIQQGQDFTDHVFRIAAMESRIEQDGTPTPSASRNCEARCIQIAQDIDSVFYGVGTMYDSDPVQTSAMILTLFDLWVRMDQCAVAACPLLGDHRPAFKPQLLDALQLPSMSSMRRLQDIQLYLHQRHRGAKYDTIFADINESCMAMRYVASSTEMQRLVSRIQDDSERARKVKEADWKFAVESYDDLTEKIDNGTCVCSRMDNGQWNIHGCVKCYHYRCRNRIMVEKHEDFLPKGAVPRAAIVFELAIPSYLSAYRNATWRILRDLAHPGRHTETVIPKTDLDNCPPLKRYLTANTNSISMASTKKCFTQTHYRFFTGKIPLSDILLPFGAEFELFDRADQLWVKHLNEPLTLQHLCGVHIPRDLLAIVVQVGKHPKPDFEGPSSYEIQSNQAMCPSHMPVHEYSAYQKLLSGKMRRWPNILVELGSSNLNFSNEDTMRILSQLAVQAGPQLQTDVLRTVHSVFRDSEFVEGMAEQIAKRLESIMKNWRETNCMELLIILSLRLFSLSSGAVRLRSEALLKSARGATLAWVAQLQKEFEDAKDGGTADRLAMYAIKAALLCRQTFGICVETNSNLSAKDLSSWIQASVSLQESLIFDLEKLSKSMKAMLVRDAKLAFHMEPLLRNAIENHPDSVGEVIGTVCLNTSNGATPNFSKWTFLSNTRWISTTTTEIRDRFRLQQTVHCNFVEGHLLIDGKPRGKLPGDIRNDPSVKELFGNKHLFAYNSSMPDMTHMLSTPIEGQSIHFGTREKQIVIRALIRDTVLEFIPRAVFTGTKDFDLPASMLDSCAHWLNLKTGILEVRRAPTFWKTRPRDWFINVPQRYAERGGNVRLVDPQSSEFNQVADMFQHFELPQKLTVYQSKGIKGKLYVELRHMELSFFVDRGGLLHCPVLKAEIDPNQDAGTWYGLDSKIVLRDTANPQRRSVIIPLGATTWQRRGIHVSIRFTSSVEYGKFEIDDVLGRISSPPEPRLLYFKALCHAITSFCLPDTLTGRTGTEEAFKILQSGAAQPWAPLASVHSILDNLAELIPRREYYPPGLQRLQKVAWNEDLTTTIQHDAYGILTQAIEKRSYDLAKFSGMAMKDVDGPNHLLHRAQVRRGLYERPIMDANMDITRTVVYRPRDRKTSERATNVYQIVRQILTSSNGVHIAIDLESTLNSWNLIGGFHDSNPLPNREPLISQIEEPINKKWGDLVNYCQNAEDKALSIFCLGLLAFAPDSNMDLLTSLVAFACVDELKAIQPPAHPSFRDFESRGQPSIEILEKQIALAYHTQWPGSPSIEWDESWQPTLIDVPLALETIRVDWIRRQQNDELAVYISQVQHILDLQRGPRVTPRPEKWVKNEPLFIGGGHERVIPSIHLDLVVKACREIELPRATPLIPTQPDLLLRTTPQRNRQQLEPEVAKLERIVKRFAATSNAIRKSYGEDLLKSLEALKKTNRMQPLNRETTRPELHVVMKEIAEARILVNSHLQFLVAALGANDSRFEWLTLGTMWPSVNTTEMLQLLRSRSGHKYGVGMKEALVSYGLAITRLQQLERIRHALLCRDERSIDEELRNLLGHENWDPLEQPDWLLLEIDSNLLIRAEQVDVAKALIKPASRKNTVLQLNMGKGKTSCIMPMVAAILADGNNLFRLVVPKALLTQTAQIAQLRLGGLVGRDFLHIPFSRQTPTRSDMLNLYAQLHQGLRDANGLLLTCHDHILSYKLSGLQRVADNKLDEAGTMIGFQTWLDTNCRDVLDESDFTLSVKTQLNYPSGAEMPVDGHPFRWQVTQGLLALVAQHIPELQKKFPKSLEILAQPGWFPMLQFLKVDVEDELHTCLLDDICAGKVPFLRTANPITGNVQRQIICKVLSDEKFDAGLFNKAVAAYTHQESAAKKLLLVRGLIINRILILCLGKRWNVQYGLHPSRHPVAVPFEAKGIPSELAEFGHVDVAITFTCLSFYYAGLTYQQFRQGLQRVLTSEDPASHYERWTSESCLPPGLNDFSVINADDEGQMHDLFRHLRKSRIVLDHYLNNFVFPAHARQFSVKLQASAWDIPLLSKGAAKTTGFSGTNDNRIILPLTIEQDDLPSLRQTNAEVLSYLLQPRSSGYQVAANSEGKRLNEKGLLKELNRQKVRIFIDAGAYILELDNRTLAKLWLKVDHDAKAAVYFRSDNRAWVLYRGGIKADAPLLTTPFASDLSQCLVYLDEAHTRGVDLKLPEQARGALTLALKQTKDYTVQAAIRLRQLRTTQSVTFFAPPEVDQSIRDVCGVSPEERIDSSHVVSWLLEQTCRTNEDMHGLYIAQGLDFCRRTNALNRHPDFLTSDFSKSKLLSVLQQPEHLSLEQLYGDQSVGLSGRSLGRMCVPQLQDYADKLAHSNHHLSLVQVEALGEVEQEREVELQLESVREVQRSIKYEALGFPGLHMDILDFTDTGVIAPKSAAIEHAFDYIARTEVGKKFGVRSTGSMFFVSKEFSRTVRLPKGDQAAADNFLRPVEWILWSSTTKTAIVIISEEVERLIPILRISAKVDKPAVHLIAYAAPVTKAMLPFNELRYYTLPPLPANHKFPDWFKVELGILAGRLYVDFSEWSSVAGYIGSVTEPRGSLNGGSAKKLSGELSGQRLADFVMEWLGLRRKTHDVLHTPMGYICMGRTVLENHPFFMRREPAENTDGLMPDGVATEETQESDEECETEVEE